MPDTLHRAKNRVQLHPGEIEGALGLVVVQPEARETVWTGKGAWASGIFHNRELNEGMEMHWGTLRMGSALVIASEASPARVCFTGTLAGGWRHEGIFRGRTFDCGQMAGEMGITRCGDRSVHTDLPGESYIHLTLSVEEDLVRQWIEDAGRETAEGILHLRRLLDGDGPPALKMPLSDAVRSTVERAIHCPYRGVARALALEARANDLVVEILDAVGSNDFATNPAAVVLRRDDLERIQGAAELLRKRLDNPPSLAALARSVGISDSKLKRGFQRVFGTTAFGYLRERRMERARALLAAGETTVLEAAEFVGYSNPSNFTTAFRRQFGVNPKQFQVTVSRQK